MRNPITPACYYVRSVEVDARLQELDDKLDVVARALTDLGDVDLFTRRAPAILAMLDDVKGVISDNADCLNERASLYKLCESVPRADWQKGITLVRYDYLARNVETYAVRRGWAPALEAPSMLAIDWDLTAQNVKHLYRTASFNDVIYYYWPPEDGNGK